MNIKQRPFTLWIAGSIEQVIEDSNSGLVDAIVTNPTVVKQWLEQATSFQTAVERILGNTELPVFIQLKGPTYQEMRLEVDRLHQISDRLIPKIPATFEGLKLCKLLTDKGVKKLITCVCSLSQAISFASFGAEYLCPYVARLLENKEDPYQLIHQISTYLKQRELPASIIPASLRNTSQVEESVAAGAGGVIVFSDLFRQLLDHKVTQESLATFEKNDWPNIVF